MQQCGGWAASAASEAPEGKALQWPGRLDWQTPAGQAALSSRSRR
jgi:hypothetical protein